MSYFLNKYKNKTTKCFEADNGAGINGAGNADANVDENDVEIVKNEFNIDNVKNFLDKDVEGKKFLETTIKNNIELWKKKELPKLQDNWKAQSNKSPLEIQMLEMQKKLDPIEKEKEQAILDNEITKELTAINVNPELLDFVRAGNREDSLAKINKLLNILEEETTKINKERMLGIVRTPQKSNTNSNIINNSNNPNSAVGMAAYLNNLKKNK